MSAIVQRIAAKALVVHGGKVLIIREAATYGDGTQRGRYHLPGGRVETGERFEDALAREVMEETGLTVKPLYPILIDEWHPVIKGVQNQIIGVFTVCKAASREVTLSSEHDHFMWIDPKNRAQYDIMDPEWEVIDRYVAWESAGLPKA